MDLAEDSKNTELLQKYSEERLKMARRLERMGRSQIHRFLVSQCFHYVSAPAFADIELSEYDRDILERHILHLRQKEAAKVRWTTKECRSFAICCLYVRAVDLPRDLMIANLSESPAPIQEATFTYIFNTAMTFLQPGEADRHHQLLLNAFRHLDEFIDTCDEEVRTRVLNLLSKSYFGSCPITNQGNMTEFYRIEIKLLRRILMSRYPHLLDKPFEIHGRRSQKIHVGILRYDFGGEFHSFAPVLDGLDRERFEVSVFAFSENLQDIALQRYPDIKVVQLDRWQLDESIRRIREEGVDILINASTLSGDFYSPLKSMLLLRASAKQVTACADVTSSGIPEVDHWLMGRNYMTQDITTEMMEPLLPMRGSGIYVPRPPRVVVHREEARRRLGFNDGQIVFVSNAHVFKLVPDLMDMWMTIMAAVPDSRLLLMPFPSSLTEKRYRRAFEKMLGMAMEQHAITEERVQILNLSGSEAILQNLCAGDVYLDCFPYCGPTSTIEALTICLPPVIMKGQTYRGSLTSGFAMELGLQSCLHSSPSAYIKSAIDLANSKEKREALRAQIAERITNVSFFDKATYVRELESVFENMVMVPGDLAVASSATSERTHSSELAH